MPIQRAAATINTLVRTRRDPIASVVRRTIVERHRQSDWVALSGATTLDAAVREASSRHT